MSAQTGSTLLVAIQPLPGDNRNFSNLDSRTELIRCGGGDAGQCRRKHGVAHSCCTERETRVWGDQAYRSRRAVIRARAQGRGITNRRHRAVVGQIHGLRVDSDFGIQLKSPTLSRYKREVA